MKNKTCTKTEHNSVTHVTTIYPPTFLLFLSKLVSTTV